MSSLEPNQLLIWACSLDSHEGALVQVTKALEMGANPNTCTGNRLIGFRTVLMLAASQGHVKVVELLIEKGADLERNHMSNTALDFAVQCYHTDVVELLIKKGAKIDHEGTTPLIDAVQAGHIKTLALLLNYKCDVNRVDSQNNTALSYAISQNHHDMLIFLLKKGAAVNGAIASVYTPLSYAMACNRNIKCVNILLSRAGLNLKNVYFSPETRGGLSGENPLSLALRFQYPKRTITMMLDRGAYIDRPFSQFLHGYAEPGTNKERDPDLVIQSNIYLKDKTICQALKECDPVNDTLSLLKKAEEWINNFDQSEKINRAKIKQLASQFHETVIPATVINVRRNSDGNTALHLAMLSGNTFLIVFLIDNEARVSIENNKGQTAYDIAKSEYSAFYLELFEKRKQEEQRETELWDLLVSSVPEDQNSLEYQKELGEKLAQYIDEKNINRLFLEGKLFTPLMIAILYGNFAAAKWLLQKENIDIRVTNSLGMDVIKCVEMLDQNHEQDRDKKQNFENISNLALRGEVLGILNRKCLNAPPPPLRFTPHRTRCTEHMPTPLPPRDYDWRAKIAADVQARKLRELFYRI